MIEAHKLFCRNTLKLKPGQSGILSNGRRIGPFEDGEKFSEEDFHTLELFELSSHGRALIDIVASVEIANLEADYDTASFRSDVQMKVASLLRRLPAQQRIVIPSVEDQHRCATTYMSCHHFSVSLSMSSCHPPCLYPPSLSYTCPCSLTLARSVHPLPLCTAVLSILGPALPVERERPQWVLQCVHLSIHCQQRLRRWSQYYRSVSFSVCMCACVCTCVHACVRVVCVHLYVAIRDSSCTISSPHPLAGVH